VDNRFVRSDHCPPPPISLIRGGDMGNALQVRLGPRLRDRQDEQMLFNIS